MPHTPIVNFEAGRIPDQNDEGSFHLDATYVFDYLASYIIPNFNENLLWLEGALAGADTIVDSVADIIAGDQVLERLVVNTTGAVRGNLTLGKNGGGDTILNFYDDAADVLRTLKWVSSISDWRIEDAYGSGHKIWHGGNDGADSGLDADTVDGLQASQFLRSDTSGTTSGNLTVQGQFYVGENGSGDSRAHFYDDNSNTWRTLLWDDSVNDWRIEGSSGAIHKLWHGGNDGTGSGLDADKLDGFHASQFLRSDADDTATGRMQFTGMLDPRNSAGFEKVRLNYGGSSSHNPFVSFYRDTTRIGYLQAFQGYMSLQSDAGGQLRVFGSGDVRVNGKQIANAGQSVGAVGSYAFLQKKTTGNLNSGSTYAGSDLRYSGLSSGGSYSDNTAATNGGGSASGTWRCMGDTNDGTRFPTTLMMRIA